MRSRCLSVGVVAWDNSLALVLGTRGETFAGKVATTSIRKNAFRETRHKSASGNLPLLGLPGRKVGLSEVGVRPALYIAAGIG